MIKALLMIVATGIGFVGSPWIGFAFGATLMALSAIPDQQELLKSYRGQPKTDIVFALLFNSGLTVIGSLAAAWLGYFISLLFKLSR